MALHIRKLEQLLVVMELGSISAAAKRLYISQPALTKSISRLEEQLGVPLFERTAKGMFATSYARSLAPFARVATVGLSKTIADLNDLRSGTAGTVAIAAPPLIAGGPLIAPVVQIRNEYPDIKLKVFVEVDELFPLLARGDADIVFATTPKAEVRFDGLEGRDLLRDELVVVMRPGHPLSGREFLTVDDLRDANWVIQSKGNVLRERLLQIHETLGLAEMDTVVECHAPEVIKAVIARTDCLGWTSRLAIADEIAAGKATYARIDHPLSIRRIGLYWRQSQLSPAARIVCDAIEEELRRRSDSHGNADGLELIPQKDSGLQAQEDRARSR